MKDLHVRIDDETWRLIQEVAAREERSIVVVVQRAIREYAKGGE